MDIVFTRSRDRRDVTVVVRGDGVRLSVPVFGPLDPIPHDLAHYVVERTLELADGFWGTVAAGAIFEGMRVLEGRQRPHAAERSRALMKAHRTRILFSEWAVDAALHAVKGERFAAVPAAVEQAVQRTGADGAALLARLRPAMEETCARWAAVPMGGTLHVTWPERRASRDDEDVYRAPVHATRAVRPRATQKRSLVRAGAR